MAVAKNKAASSKMKSTLNFEREQKAALSATIKQQQHNERMEEKAAAAGALADSGAATGTLQKIYTGKDATRFAGRKAAGLITVRVVSSDGQDNIQLPARATFGDLRAKIAAELKVPADRQVLALDRSCRDVVKKDSTTLAAKGIVNGSIVGLQYPGFVRVGKSGFQSSVPLAETHTKAKGGKGSLREEMGRTGKLGITLGEFERLQAERCLVVKQTQTEDAACSAVNCDRDALDAFQKYLGDALQVLIRHARTHSVGKHQSCMF